MEVNRSIIVAIFALISVAYCDISCSNPSSSQGTYVGESHECVALVKAKCTGMLNLSTPNWKKGRKVQGNCNSIAKYTAVATFEAPGSKYKGHAAIFESCDSSGVWVWDQWNGQPVHRRKMTYGNSNNYPSNDGAALYTVEK